MAQLLGLLCSRLSGGELVPKTKEMFPHKRTVPETDATAHDNPWDRPDPGTYF